MGLLAEGATRKPAREEVGEGEANGDEGVAEVAFRPQRRAHGLHASLLSRGGKERVRSAMTKA